MPSLNAEKLARAKSLGFSDRQIAHLTGSTEDAVRAERKKLGLIPSYRLVDTCAAEFAAAVTALRIRGEKVDEIVAFARRGGLVLADTDPGTFDQHSRRRSVPPLAGIADLPEVMIRSGGQCSPD